MARNFLSELDDLFKINGSIDDLDNNVARKYALFPAPPCPALPTYL
jgi:hypothetical protein